ncbi:30S ribosomal protein S8 [Candidatus Deianiraea vastatrix]|uniref:Small ribosomal subunit protein uS8 n=2 Tax=Candidatus Deianiraea vastatrix TaxID=2163644 RepID=A0A5B8XCZ9_9RICK|nr:30S ribosomal protein S8 [Candidatus Deianiraea vastatrix]
MSISDFVVRLKNHKSDAFSVCSVKNSNIVKASLDILIKSGFILWYKQSDNSRIIDVCINIDSDGKNPMMSAYAVTKPSKKIYKSVDQIRLMMKKIPFRLVVVSTSKGLLSGYDAIKMNIGGEILFVV